MRHSICSLVDGGVSDESATKPLSNSKKTDPEVDRREAGKWETIRHYRQPLRAEEVANPWLKVSCLARRGGSLDDSSAAIPFALLISVISKSKESNLYDEVRSYVQSNAFSHVCARKWAIL